MISTGDQLLPQRNVEMTCVKQRARRIKHLEGITHVRLQTETISFSPSAEAPAGKVSTSPVADLRT